MPPFHISYFRSKARAFFPSYPTQLVAGLRIQYLKSCRFLISQLEIGGILKSYDFIKELSEF